MSFAERFTPRNTAPASSMHHVILVTDLRDSTGKEAWYFVKIPTTKHAIFKRELAKENVNLCEFGEVLASGYGTQPPARVKQRMTHVYGFRDKD